MEAQVHFGYLRFTDEIGITVCSPIPVPDLCLPPFKLHFLKESTLTDDKFHAFTRISRVPNVNLIDSLRPFEIDQRFSPATSTIPSSSSIPNFHGIRKTLTLSLFHYFVDR